MKTHKIRVKKGGGTTVFRLNDKKTRVPLETQLELAVAEENFELAAKLRDRINKREAKKIKK